jgi:two-component system chemotaxis response regulator CheB
MAPRPDPGLSGGHDIIVVGGSAGAADALRALLAALPKSLPASIFIAYHIPAHAGGILHTMLAGASALEVKLAEDGEPIRRGIVYVARPDRHLLVGRERVSLARGPRENHWRPAVDPLFRSAAAAHGARVIAVVLTGMLDDGTAGVHAVKRCGGITIVQDPLDAAYPDMPQSALDNAPVDYKATIKDMAGLLQRLVTEPAGASPTVPKEIQEEVRISATGVAEPDALDRFMCPDCGGPLQKLEDKTGSDLERYRCMVGHSWSPGTLLSMTDEALESTVWAAIRLFRQRSHLLASRAEREREAGRMLTARLYREQTQESLDHARRLQELLLHQSSGVQAGAEDARARAEEAAGETRRDATNA